MTSDERRKKWDSMDKRLDHICNRVDHLHFLIVGDGAERSFADKMRTLWEAHEERGRGLMWLVCAVLALILERVSNYIRIGHS